VQVSETDSFIEEVTEEVRRDRLFQLFRRYGWIAAAAVLLLVGGAAFREYRLAQQRVAAEAVGDGIMTAVRQADLGIRAETLAELPATRDAAAIVGLLTAGTDLEAGEPARAVAQLEALAADPDLAPRYRHLAVLQRLMILAPDMPAQDRIAELAAVASPGAPYRLLAEEQIAIAEAELGMSDVAIERLGRILEDQELTAGLRRRVADLIVALGGAPGETDR